MNPTSRKLRVAVLYGGRSGEHEVSLQSAASVINHLDPARFEVIPIGISKEGRWQLNDITLIEKGARSLPIYRNSPEVVVPPYPGTQSLVSAGTPAQKGILPPTIDVVFPVMHGPLYEDGAVQGLLELAGIPYVGSGVLSSAIGMDKDMAKRLVRAGGMEVTPYFALSRAEWERTGASKLHGRILKEFKSYSVFVKPANQGSSVGIHKVKGEADLLETIEDAFRYDVKILIEKGIDAREIELSVLEDAKLGAPPLVSVVGEILPRHEFYSYEAKYLDENGAGLEIPAKITDAQKQEAQKLAAQIFLTLECEGMARVDLFLDRESGKYYFNEVNTLPGFTSISMYPKLWEASGVPYAELLTRLIDLAISRHERKSKLVRDFKSE